MNHADLVSIGFAWLRRNGFGVAFRELVTTAPETPDAIGFNPHSSALIECKVSRSDFLRDKEKFFRKQPEYAMGEFRYYMCPTGLILTKELPPKWGLLYVSDKGRVAVIAGWNPKSYRGREEWKWESNLRYERGLMFSALRRLELRGYMESIYDKSYLKPAVTVPREPDTAERG